MSEASSVEEILAKAKEEEGRYEWLKAADCYRKALTAVAETDYLKKGEINERLAYAVYKGAFQAENSNEFRERMHQATLHHEKAKELYGKLNESVKTPRMLRCEAMIAFAGSWVASEAAEKKRLLDECWRLTKDSLKALKESGKTNEYGKTSNQLSRTAVFKFCFDWNFETRKTAIREALEQGEQAIRFLSTLDDPRELATAYAQTASYLSAFGYYFTDLDEKEIDFQKAKTYWRKAKELDEEAALFEVLYPFFGPHLALWGEATPEAFSNLERALEHGEKNKDKFIIGAALDWLTYHSAWTIGTIDNYDEVVKVVEEAFQYAEDAKQSYSVISFISPRADNAWIEALQAQFMPGYSRETDLTKKRDMLGKAIEAARDGFSRAENSGYPEVIGFMHGILCNRFTQLAEIETNIDEKKKLLEAALRHGKEYARNTEQFRPLEYWDNGGALNGLADIKYALSYLTDEPENKQNGLQEAIVDLQRVLSLKTKALTVVGKRSPMLLGELGQAQFSEGVWLSQLYKLTSDKQHLRKSAESFGEAVESFEKVQRTSRIAECYWKAAQVYSEMDEHLRAADNFSLASDNYGFAAEKIPQLGNLYQDYASYMQAWSEIEKARYHHAQNEYDSAESHFSKASELHEASKQWSYMAPNYSAWAKVAHAEELSRKDQSEEALQAFQEAGRLFREAKKSLEAKVTSIQDQEENRMVLSLTSACDTRCAYCEARMAFEQARLFGKKGDHALSAKKYGESIKSLENIIPKLESEQDRTEFRFMISFSRGWEKMAQAEARTDPAMYLEAANIFEEARDASPSERAKLLTLGHSRFCRALEAGARFSDTRDPVLYSAAKQNLESAMNYYLKADFKMASEYAKATGLLLDAYLYMSNASRESEPGKKAKLYIITERVLQASAGSYVNADNSAKSEQVQRLLANVREERELALSLNEVLQAPLIPSTTPFPSPTPTYEQAVGLERLEHAQVQENLIASKKELRVGEILDLEIELVNPGRATAVLDKIEEAFPESFGLATKPESYRVEGHSINMKGRRLDPLKAEEVKFSVKPKHKGSFTVRPRILYLDENGKAKSHEPEPLTITVKELGIKGWITGEA
jgi:exonuclease VII small subunit